ncbi:hypothetical protein [Amphritea sp. HPY]|uniref:hypothetical protein n=1 Tax=Amphritea sp. HPY TaxID=3421652 RepID=UPI003D7D7060
MYIYESSISVGDSKKDVLVIFSGQLECSAINFGEVVETELQKYSVKPEELLFIYPDYIKEEVDTAVIEGGSFLSGVTRYESIPVTAIAFDSSANLNATAIRGESLVCNDMILLQKELMKGGLHNLARSRKDQVIMKAPSGTIFIKPSNDEYDEFIRASGLAVGDSEHQFVAFCLLSKKPAGRDIKKLFIDSSSISAYVEVIAFYLSKFSKAACRTVSYDSFSSYDGVDFSKPDIVDDVWVIISASRSNSLGKKIAKEWGLDNDQVITILSYTKTEDEVCGDETLVNISSLSESSKKELDTGALVKVKVVGEHFTAEVEAPNSVMIKSIHKSKAIASWIDPNGSNGLVKCNVKHAATAKVSSVYVDCERYLNEDTSLRDWLIRIVEWYVPKKVNFLVYEHDETSSEALASLVTDVLGQNGITNFSKVDFSSAETQVNGDGAVIILTPVLCTGEKLLKLNRNLRISGHMGNRIFISPFVIFDSKAKLDKCVNSLLYGPNNMKYLFYSKNQAFTGAGVEGNSWESELQITDNLSHSFWQARSDQLRQYSVGLNGCIGTPSLHVDQKLEFTKDFAFWREGYDPEEINPEAVYLTISTILQGLRDKKVTEFDQDSLYSYVYQHSVISPDNFTRFNDSLLQSCLWRAASSRELDYRSSVDLSEGFTTILNRLISDNASGTCNAALDLLIGIATNRIKVSRDHLRLVLEHGKKLYEDVDYSHSVELIDYIYNRDFSVDVGMTENEVPI